LEDINFLGNLYNCWKNCHNRYNKATEIKLVWTCTENGRKLNSQKSIVGYMNLESTRPKGRPEIDGKMK
jgi:hypothetical protein